VADSQSDRNIVQVFSRDQEHLLRPAGKTIITFEERAAGSPEAIRSWFYQGQIIGHDFVYPKPKAVALAKANNVPVPSIPAELAENTTKPAATLADPPVVGLRQAPLKAQKPTEEDVEIAEVFVAEEMTPATLPATASFTPLIGLIGMLSLGLFGLTPVDSGADISVVALEMTQNHHTLNTYYDNFAGGWRWGGGFGDSTHFPPGAKN